MTAHLSTGGVLSATVYSRSGATIQAPLLSATGSGSITDPNGNQISASVASNTTTFTDTLGTTALTVVAPTPPSSTTCTYTGPTGGQASYTVKYTSKTVQTNFGCSGKTEYGPTQQYLVSSISLPDGTSYTFTYETTPGHSPNVTGRIASVTLPTGGTITYGYSGGSNGITCADGSTATLTRTTPDGTWIYAHTEPSGYPFWTTVLTDPAGNQTIYGFVGGLETERMVWQGGSTTLETVETCYNGWSNPCSTHSYSLPITNRIVQVMLPSLSASETYTAYNSYGLPTETDEYTYGPTLARKTLISYNTSLTNIHDRPSQVQVLDSGGTVRAQTTNGYDSHGNLTLENRYSTATAHLSRSFTYNSTGTVATATDVNNNVATYTYATGSPSCSGAFPTSVQLSNTITPTLSRSMTWNCSGGVMTQLTDENGQPTNYTYNDAYYWRLTAVADPTNAVTNIAYSTSPSFATESTLNFNGSTSTVDTRTTLDGLGRVHVTQRQQSQGAANYDSVETDYNSLGRAYRVSAPYSAGAGGLYGGSTYTTTTYDTLNRPLLVTAGGGGVSYSYPKNDVLVTVMPAPSGEHTKRRQLEYDALGRLTSVCEITSATGSGNCAQNTTATGYRTSYTYSALNSLTAVTQNAQGSPTQSRSYSYDMLGRLLSESNPESGATNYVYDSSSTCGTTTYNGDLVKRTDAVGNVTCYAYDALHRVTDITYPSGSYAGATPAKTFVYDSATVNGATMQYAKGRLAEAYTGSLSSKITDLGFGYSPRGEVADVYQSTPNSGGYYHVAGLYWENGLLKQLSGVGLPNMTYTPEGEGRPYSVAASVGQSPVTSTSYNPYATPPNVLLTLGSGDSDQFNYDSNTGRMTSYQFNVGSPAQSVVGNLTWNANGTLGTLAITDPVAGNQTCNYTHDDLARIASANCGSSWSQTFAPDIFSNLSKSGTVTFQPTYNLSTNRVSQVGGLTPTYDANGNLTYDTYHTYTWDAEGKPVTIDSIGLTYDALGRMVEQNRGGSYTQIVYGPGGNKLALMSGQTLAKGFVPLSGGATAVYNASGLAYYRHADWLGSSRLASLPSGTTRLYYDGAYAPYGENYAEVGTIDRNLTGQNQDTISSGPYPLYDFLAREYHPTWGRWLNPDPAGLAAVDPSNPQSWNRYAYVLNSPASLTDPLGLDDCGPNDVVCETNEHNIEMEKYAFMTELDLAGYDLHTEFESIVNSAYQAESSSASATYLYDIVTVNGTSSDTAIDTGAGVEFQEGLWAPGTTYWIPIGAVINRVPDFWQLTINLGPWWGGTFQVSVDRNKHVYVAPGVNIGKSPGGGSVAVSYGWMAPWNELPTSPTPPTPQELKSFLTRGGCSAGAAYGGGLFFNWSSGGQAWTPAAGTPQAGISCGYGFKVW